MLGILKKPARGWLRDWRLWILAALLTYTLFGFFCVPWLLRSQIPKLTQKYLGRESAVGRASFNPFTLVTVLGGFELRDKDGSRLLAFDELRVNFQVSGVFRRAWTFSEIRLTGPHIVARIVPDGRLAIHDLLEPKPGEPPPDESKPAVLPRVFVGHLEIGTGRIDFIDESRSPKFETALEPLSLKVDGLTTIPDQKGDHVITFGLEGGAQVQWSGKMTVEPLLLEGRIEVSDLRLPKVWAYAGQGSPLDIVSGKASLSLPYRIEKPAGQKLRAELNDAAVGITDFIARPKGTEDDWLKLARGQASGIRVRWPEQSVEVALVRITKPWVKMFVAEDGHFNWHTLFGAETATTPASATVPAPAGSQTSRGGATSGSADPNASPAWSTAIAALVIADGSLDWEDRMVAPPVKIVLSPIEARLANLTSAGTSPVETRATTGINGAGQFTATGMFALEPASAEFDFGLDGLEVPVFQPYLSKVGQAVLTSGAVGVHGKFSYLEGRKPAMRFEGRASVDRLALADPAGTPVLSWEGLAIEDAHLALAPNRLRVKSVTLQKPFAQILIDKQGKVGAMKLFHSASGGPPEAAAPAEEVEEPPANQDEDDEQPGEKDGDESGEPDSGETAPAVAAEQGAGPGTDAAVAAPASHGAAPAGTGASPDGAGSGAPSAPVPPSEAAAGTGTPSSASASPAAGAGSKAEPAFPFEIGSIVLHDGIVDYADQSLILPFATEIHSAEGKLTGLSTSGASGSRLTFDGKVDEYGFAKAEGTVRLFDPYAATQLTVLFRNIDMSHLTPYVAQFAGYSIKEGKLDLEITYTITNRVLVGNHKLVASELQLGDKVTGAKASLPLRLAVALLKDKDGKIDLELPIEGSVDNPQFAYRKVIWTAFKRIIVNLVAAPFRFLGHLLGIKGEDLQYVSFPPGQSTLLPPEQEKLAKMVEGLKSRPGITIQAAGRFDPVADAAAMREAKLDALIAARSETLSATAGDETTPIQDQVLDALYTETFSAEAREALRLKYTAAAPVPAGEAPKKPKRGEPPAPATVFDGAGYYKEVREELIKSQTASPEELAALASARAQAIVSALTAAGAVDPSRVTAAPPEEVKKSKKGIEPLIPSELVMPKD